MESFGKGLLAGMVAGAALCYVAVSFRGAPVPMGRGAGGVDASAFGCLLGGCGEAPLLIVEGTAVRWIDLPAPVRATLHDRSMAAYKDAREVLRSFAASMAIAKERGDTRPLDELPSLEEWLAQEPISDAEVEAYFTKNRSSFAPDADPMVLKERIRQVVRNTRTAEVTRTKVAELSQGGKVSFPLALPRHAPIAKPSADLPLRRGGVDATRWLVEISPYWCESCAFGKLRVDEFLSRTPEVAFWRVPSGRGDALTSEIARAVFCANSLGRETYDAFDARAFQPAPGGYDPLVRDTGNEKAARSHVMRLARESGVKDEPGFEACLASAEAAGFEKAMQSYAKAAGAQVTGVAARSAGTTLVLDGQRVPGGPAGLDAYAAELAPTPGNGQSEQVGR